MCRKKLTPYAILEWRDGFERPPVVYPVADSDEEVETIENLLEPLRRDDSEKSGAPR